MLPSFTATAHTLESAVGSQDKQVVTSASCYRQLTRFTHTNPQFIATKIFQDFKLRKRKNISNLVTNFFHSGTTTFCDTAIRRTVF
jgi:hypothetical protein